MATMYGEICGWTETPIGETYKGYELYFFQQVDLHTGEPFADGSGTEYYTAKNVSNPRYKIGDSIFNRSLEGLRENLDYRVDVRPFRRAVRKG